MNADDYFAIQNLVFSYSSLLDRADFDGVGELFAHATVLNRGTVVADRDPRRLAQAYKDWVAANLYECPQARHFVSNLVITPISDEMATATSSLMVFQNAPRFMGHPVVGGDYRDVLEKENGEWRFVERRLANDLATVWRAQ